MHPKPGPDRHPFRAFFMVACITLLSACSGGDGDRAFNPYEGFASERYAEDSMWLCRPGLPADQCLVNDLDGTAIEPDGSLAELTHRAAANAPYDCFYVYPTVDLSGQPGNHTDFSDVRPMLDPLLAQAAPFTSLCRMFAPLYRQGTLGSFGSPQADEIFDLAYGDVSEAFRHYMGQFNDGRDVVIMGHSQGTNMVTRLLQDEFDAVPEMRSRLIVALLVGGSVAVREGQLAGATFENIPLCSSAEETGCAIAFRTYAADYPPAAGSNVVGPAGTDTACVNPAAQEGGRVRVSSAWFPREVHQPIFFVNDPSVAVPDVDTFFMVYPEFYSAECVKDDRGTSYLAIDVAADAGDVREDPILYTHPTLTPSFLGTHVIDYSFVLGDLLEAVRIKGEAHR